MDTVWACSPPPPYILPPQPAAASRAAIRPPEASTTALRHCEGPLPSTLAVGFFASDETEGGKAFVEDKAFVGGRPSSTLRSLSGVGPRRGW